MNRELKFRIWDTQKNSFIESPTRYKSLAISCDGRGVYSGHYDDCDTEDRYIIQQYTGLKDFKGREIYEGDILQELITNETDTAIGVCKQVLGGWKIFSISGSYWHGWKQEVIGNIFENNELLKL